MDVRRRGLGHLISPPGLDGLVPQNRKHVFERRYALGARLFNQLLGFLGHAARSASSSWSFSAVSISHLTA
jgi:hypothetical protein